MARQLELRTTTFDPINGGKELSYGDLMLVILRAPPPGRGVTLDEMLTAIEVIEPVEKAIEQHDASVTLTDQQWTVLRDKLNAFNFALVDHALVRFGQHIRNAPEIGVVSITAAE